jgi:hypothetical protein
MPVPSKGSLQKEWTWGRDQGRAFKGLKRALDSAPVLRWPNTQPPYQLHTNWSMLEIGTVLTQKDDDGKNYVIAYAS